MGFSCGGAESIVLCYDDGDDEDNVYNHVAPFVIMKGRFRSEIIHIVFT